MCRLRTRCPPDAAHRLPVSSPLAPPLLSVENKDLHRSVMPGGVIKVTPSPGSFLVQDLAPTAAVQGAGPAPCASGRRIDGFVRGVVTLLLAGVGVSFVAGAALGHETWRRWQLPLPAKGLKSACAAYRQHKYVHNQRNPLLNASVERLDGKAYQDWLLQGDRLNQRLLQATGLSVLDVVAPASPQQVTSPRLIRAAAQCFAAGIDFGDVRKLREFPQGPEGLG